MTSEVGTIFTAVIKPIDGRVAFLATYQVQDLRRDPLVEVPEHEVFDTYDEARGWLMAVAGGRGFPKIRWDADTYVPDGV